MEGRQRMRRWGAALAAVSLCLVLLTGCGQGGPVETAEDAGTQREATDGQASGTSQTDTVGEDDATSGAAPEQEETPGTPVDALPADLPDVLTFCSGAGAWRTNLSLTCDGSFTGQFTDWDSGSDPTYPGGLYRICTFSGTFSDLRQLDEHSYSMMLENLTCQETEGEEWVEDGTLYIGSTPYGLEGGTAFYLYRPEASTDVLTTQSLQVEWPQWNLPETVPEGQLGCWMLYNADMDQGFFSYT